MVPLGVRHGANAAIQSGLKAQLFYLDFYSTTQKIPKQTGRDPGELILEIAGTSSSVIELDATPSTSFAAIE